MRLVKKIFFIFFLLILYFNVYSIDYYICLGSFIDNDNAIEYSVSLSEIGINTIHEKTRIKNKYFTRVLLNTKFKNLKNAINELNKLMNNEVIKKAKITDLWIRPGRLLNAQKINTTKLSSNKKNNETKNNNEKKQEKQISETKNVKNEKESTKEEDKIETEKESNKKIPLEELDDEKESKEKEIAKQIEQKKEENSIIVENEYKVINNEGYANCIFATEPIEYGNEKKYELKTVFNKPEKVFARCYFPKNIGKINSKDFWHEIWINGKFVRKTIFNTPPDPKWDQIQIWITEEDYADVINSLEKGKYKIIIWVLKNEEIKKNDKTEIKTIKLSKGEFTYIVP